MSKSHLVWIIQENHSFDNYFGKFPSTDGIPPFICLPKMPGSRSCVKTFHMPSGQPLIDLEHSWETTHAAYDNGTIDGGTSIRETQAIPYIDLFITDTKQSKQCSSE
jgi:phospholipase C